MKIRQVKSHLHELYALFLCQIFGFWDLYHYLKHILDVALLIKDNTYIALFLKVYTYIELHFYTHKSNAHILDIFGIIAWLLFDSPALASKI